MRLKQMTYFVPTISEGSSNLYITQYSGGGIIGRHRANRHRRLLSLVVLHKKPNHRVGKRSLNQI